MPRKSFFTLVDHLHEATTDSLPTMVDKHVKEQVQQQVPKQVRNQVLVYVAKGLILERKKNKEEMEKMIAKAILQKHNPQLHQQDIGIWLALQIKFRRLQVPQTTCRTPAVLPRDQGDPHDFAHPEGENSAKRQKTSEYEAYVSGESSFGHYNEQEQGLLTSGNQEQVDDYDFRTDSYASDDDEIPTKLMKNFLKSNIVWESRKEILVSLHPQKTIPLVISYQRDPEAPALSLINQDILYLKKGNSKPKKIVLSLHKFAAVVFNDDDIKDRTSRLVNKCVKKFNSYARYGVEHWKNPHAKIFYIRKQKELGKQKEPDFKNLNKNDIEDMYLLITNGKKVNLTAPTISFPGNEEFEMFSIIYEPVHGIIYKNSKKDKRVMRHSEIHKFCDATMNRVLEGLKSYNNDVRYGYIQRELTKDKVEYLKLFEEEIKVSKADENMGVVC
uniref:Uncharacterized protein n=1 Tax=Tanacetum cinerariifolium TaxID=118510 RepID=A0A699KFH5_TANCI|nr:hypothetical protein [Tanacetum cinerariifolium]